MARTCVGVMASFWTKAPGYTMCRFVTWVEGDQKVTVQKPRSHRKRKLSWRGMLGVIGSIVVITGGTIGTLLRLTHSILALPYFC